MKRLGNIYYTSFTPQKDDQILGNHWDIFFNLFVSRPFDPRSIDEKVDGEGEGVVEEDDHLDDGQSKDCQERHLAQVWSGRIWMARDLEKPEQRKMEIKARQGRCRYWNFNKTVDLKNNSLKIRKANKQKAWYYSFVCFINPWSWIRVILLAASKNTNIWSELKGISNSFVIWSQSFKTLNKN